MSTQEDVAALKAEMAHVKSELGALREDVQQLLAIMNAGKGAWRTMAVLGGAVIAIGGLAITIWQAVKA